MKKHKQKGFAHLATFLFLIIFGLIGFTGWYVWHSKAETNISLTNASADSTATTNTKKTTTPVPTSTTSQQKYLAIKEWGVRVALTDGVSDTYYTAGNNDTPVFTQAGLSLESLKNTQCRANAWPPALYIRYTAQDTDPVSGELLTKQYGTAHYIGKYYYAYLSGLGVNAKYGCQSTQANQNIANTAANTFSQIINTIEATN